MVNCPACDAAIDIEEDELDEGDSLVCEECGASLNVAGVNPLDLEVGDEEEEDKEDEKDDDDEDASDDEEDDNSWR